MATDDDRRGYSGYAEKLLLEEHPNHPGGPQGRCGKCCPPRRPGHRARGRAEARRGGKRSALCAVMVTPEEHAALYEFARVAGAPFSQWARGVLLDAVEAATR